MTGSPADPIDHVVDHSMRVAYGDLPETAVEAAQRGLLDTIAAAIAGHRSAFGRMVVQRATEAGGRQDSAIVGTRCRVPAAEAAFVNAILARTLELDDVHEGSPRVGLGHGGHINTMVVPAALAALETSPVPVSGKELIAAIALGGDLIARIRLAGGNAGKLGWEGPTFGGFGAAVAVARVLGLDRNMLRNAMGAVYAQCAGNVQATSDGAWDVWLNAGTAARAGLLAAELAREGYKGTRGVMLGSSGLYPLYFRGEYHEDALLGRLGEYFEGENVSIKPYASCKASHHAIYTAIKLVEGHGIRIADIARIVIESSQYKMRLIAVDGQGAPKRPPATVGEAQFHLPYAMAIGLARKSVYPDDIEQCIDDTAVADLASRIEIRHSADKDLLQQKEGYPPDDVRIVLNDGSEVRGCELFVKGHPRQPMGAEALREKFFRCVALGAGHGASGTLDGAAIVSCIDALPSVPDARKLCALLRPEQ